LFTSRRTAGAGEPKPGNGEIVSESGEAYEDKSYAIQAAKKFGPTNAVIITDG
jgi:hypothetical protein